MGEEFASGWGMVVEQGEWWRMENSFTQENQGSEGWDCNFSPLPRAWRMLTGLGQPWDGSVLRELGRSSPESSVKKGRERERA